MLKVTPQKAIYRLISFGNPLRALVLMWRKALVCIRWWSSGVFAVPSTKCFENPIKRREHFGWHRIDFGVKKVAVYEMLADRFLCGPQPAGTFQCTRSPGGDMVRFNQATNEFGILSRDNVIRTYYTPRFCATAPAIFVAAKKCHNRPTHLDYAQRQC